MTLQTRNRLLGIIATALLVAPITLGQDDRDEQDEHAPIVSIQLTPLLLNNLLDKASERLTKDYGLDEYQQEQMRQVLQDRIPKFLREHRAELQQLVNEWVESASGDTPPTADEAAEWADRALPLVEEFQGLVTNVSDDMREFLTDEQEITLDGYMAGIQMATQSVSNRLHVFKDGGFDPEIHWPGSRKARQYNRQQVKKLRNEVESVRAEVMAQGSLSAERSGGAASGKAGSRAEQPRPKPGLSAKTSGKPKDEWALYVERFIERYQLNDEQTQKAHTFLHHQQQQRDRHLQRSAAKMENLKRMFANAKTPRQRELAESAYRRFSLPLDRMFEKLKQQLNTLPSRTQRAAAAGRSKQHKPGSGGESR